MTSRREEGDDEQGGEEGDDEQQGGETLRGEGGR